MKTVLTAEDRQEIIDIAYGGVIVYFYNHEKDKPKLFENPLCEWANYYAVVKTGELPNNFEIVGFWSFFNEWEEVPESDHTPITLHFLERGIEITNLQPIQA